MPSTHSCDRVPTNDRGLGFRLFHNQPIDIERYASHDWSGRPISRPHNYPKSIGCVIWIEGLILYPSTFFIYTYAEGSRRGR